MNPGDKPKNIVCFRPFTLLAYLYSLSSFSHNFNSRYPVVPSTNVSTLLILMSFLTFGEYLCNRTGTFDNYLWENVPGSWD